MGWEDKNSRAGLMSQSRCQKTYPTLCPNWLSAEYQSPLGAQETDGGLQDLPRKGGPGRHPRLPDRDAGKLLPGVGGVVGG